MIQEISNCKNDNALPFNLVRSPLFVKLLKVVREYGRGFKVVRETVKLLKVAREYEARVSSMRKGGS